MATEPQATTAKSPAYWLVFAHAKSSVIAISTSKTVTVRFQAVDRTWLLKFPYMDQATVSPDRELGAAETHDVVLTWTTPHVIRGKRQIGGIYGYATGKFAGAGWYTADLEVGDMFKSFGAFVVALVNASTTMLEAAAATPTEAARGR